jgi:regulator of replication initiation timing
MNKEKDDIMDKKELMLAALQQRIGELELQSASFRAEITMLMDENAELKSRLENDKAQDA